MGFSCGIVGLPNVGKSTLFSALTAIPVPAENYEFCTIEPNRGIVPVPDPRLTEVAALFKPERVTPTHMEFVDVAGLVEGASRGEGLGNRFLAAIREVDAIIHVLRCFPDPRVSHRHGRVDPVRDLEIVETELILKDLEGLDRRIAMTAKKAQGGDKEARQALPVLERIEAALNSGKPVRSIPFSKEEQPIVASLFLLTSKPILLVANVAEDQTEADPTVQAVFEAARSRGTTAITVAARVEAELAALPEEEREEFRSALGLGKSGLSKLIIAGYKLLDLVTFFTTVGVEVRAWTVPAGTTASRAAGRIHSDMEKGFIRAEVIGWEALLRAGSEAAARASGALRSEGRDYVVRDGDVLRILFR